MSAVSGALSCATGCSEPDVTDAQNWGVACPVLTILKFHGEYVLCLPVIQLIIDNSLFDTEEEIQSLL